MNFSLTESFENNLQEIFHQMLHIKSFRSKYHKLQGIFYSFSEKIILFNTEIKWYSIKDEELITYWVTIYSPLLCV